MRISTLSESECKVVLANHRVAHLACTNNWRPYVVAIHYVFADDVIYAFSLPGKKIEWMRYNPLVCLMVEEKQQGRAWKSVVVDGLYEELRDGIGRKHDEREHAWSLLGQNANWWEPGALKPETTLPSDQLPPVFFRILVKEISGRQARE
ncbi:pyridoxamine 5'-phosphate oxidase family protein [Mesorhizobium sp. BAC0120]|uniref:pyridoxamine 5'-phosphate oxidase family protein n=1 Tax=Mesorhizobium sp. BAC0120 TaxID=3090670 RepID=UPI00298D5A66|nr:pyridoxamine 5'-phosphate oxidase family protein [Mesorhizobium sp. BAC0120]MDW6023144.1 pyridoxamine 5'-phosphate oxidase family protein [Mesorhizobium sp. BAC0120]